MISRALPIPEMGARLLLFVSSVAGLAVNVLNLT
jgi:hypothetical protein